MHRLKSFFIVLYMASLLFTLLWAALGLVGKPGNLALWGVVLACGAPLTFFARLLLAPIARTDPRLNWMPIIGTAGTLLALFSGVMGLLPAMAALTNGVILALVYIHWYSRFGGRDAPALSIGSQLPELTLQALDGRDVTTGELTQKPALWLFYRGNWCPLCMAQIREIATEYRRLHERGVAVYLISPQPDENSLSLSRRFDAPMQFLRDQDNLAARRLGILAAGGLPMGMQALGYDSDVPMPTVFITAPGGRVVYSDLTDNYRMRPQPAEFMAALDRAGL
jgi:peroxiredoxin